MGLSITPVITVSVNPSAIVSKLDTDEQIFGCRVVVELDNSDGSLDAADYEGKSISFSMTPGGGIPTCWVWSQGHDSREGKKILRLICVDAWTLLRTCQANIVAQQWNNPAMLDEEGNPYTRFVNYYGKSVSTIISTILSQTIEGTLSNGGAMPTVLKPVMAINNAFEGVQEALGYTPGFLRVNGTVFTYVDPSTLPLANSYDTDDATSVTISDTGVTLPNRVYVEALDPESTLFQEESPIVYVGSAQDDASHTALGIWVDYHQQDYSGSLTSIEDCNAVADSILKKMQSQRAQGFIVTVHTTNQTLLEKIQGTDARGNSVTGVIYGIRRVYDRGVYRTEFTLGGVAGKAGGEVPEPAPIITPVVTPPVTPPFDFLPAYLPAIIDIDFTAVDDDDITWTAGTIKTADGSVWDVNSGSKHLANDDVYYAYYDVVADTGVIEWTQQFSQTVSHERILIGFFKKGVNGEEALIVIGTKGADLYIDVLSAITANLGLINAGEIRLGEFEVGHENNLSYFTGWRLWLDESGIGCMAGIQYQGGISWPDNIQWYSGTDGRFYAGGGTLIVDKSGLTFTAGGTTYLLEITGDELLLSGTGFADIRIHACGDLRLNTWVERPGGQGKVIANAKFEAPGGYFSDRLKIPVGTDMYD
jgi:hypothetical protein